MTPNEAFLITTRDAAKRAGHIFPEHAACEAALESAWGTSKLYTKGNNIFGNKAPAKLQPGQLTFVLQTREVINGKDVIQNATWLMFPSISDAFYARMALLNRLFMYRQALHAKTGEEFVQQVSAEWRAADVVPKNDALVFGFNGQIYEWVQGRWSTAPNRASAVMKIYNAHRSLFDEPVVPATVTI